MLTYITVTAPGWAAFQARSCGAVIESASEQPASGSGSRTVFSGERIDAVSAMKCTPQKAITLAVGGRRLLGEAERVADEVGHVLDLGQLVVVGEDHRPALLRERAHLGLEGRDVVEREQGHFGGRASRARERSRAGAEWVRAPIET